MWRKPNKSHGGLISKTQKDLEQLYCDTTLSHLKITKDSNRQITNEDSQIANVYMRHLLSRKCKSKAHDTPLTLIKMLF